MSSEPTATPAEQLEQEIARVREKQQALEDPELREALQMKIAHLEAKLLAMPKEEAVEPELLPEKPTPEQLHAADGLIRQARVEKMRGNVQRSTELLKEAVEAAPTAPAVLEALGDDLMERKQRKEALNAYKRAVKLDPTNVGLERKYAELVLGSSISMSFDEAMRADWSESPLLSSNDHVASGPAATLLSIFLPGLGHIVLGRTATGVAILCAWIASFLWLTLMKKDLAEFGAKLYGRASGAQPNYLVLIPLILLVGIFIGTINSLRVPKKLGGRGKVDRPTPPVNLPFD